MAKGDIACFEQFLLLSLCFKNLSSAKASESVYMKERVNMGSLFIEPFPTYKTSAIDYFDNVWSEIEIKQFLSF